jgi:hypothetical protein
LLDYDSSLDRYEFTDGQTAGKSTEHIATRSTARLTLQELASRFTSERNRGEHWVSKTQGEKADHIALLCEILGGDTDIQTISSADAQRAKDVLVRYPKNRKKNALTRTLSLDEVLKLTECSSSDNLRLIGHFEKGGFGSSGVEVKRPACGAASGGLR